MRTSLKGLFASLEDGNDVNDTEIVISPDQTVEEETGDVVLANQDIEETGGDVEELQDISEGLEGIVASLEAAVADGGLDPQAAVFMQQAVGAYTARLGLKASEVTPSLESFGGASGRAAATTISLEGIKETIQKVWQAIKNAVMKAIAAVKNFFAKIFGGIKKLKDRCAALKKSVSDLGSKKASGKIKVPSANTLRFNGKADIAAIKTGLSKTEVVGKEMCADLPTAAKKFYDQAAQAITNAAANKATKENVLQDVLTSASHDVIQIGEKVSAASMAFSGDCVYKMEREADTGGEATAKVTVPTLKKAFVGKDVAENFEIDAPDAGSLKAVLDSVDAILSTMEGKKAAFDALTKAREAAVAQSEKFVGIVKSGKINEAWTNAKVSMALRLLNRDLSRPVSQFYSQGFAICRAALALVDRGVTSFK